MRGCDHARHPGFVPKDKKPDGQSHSSGGNAGTLKAGGNGTTVKTRPRPFGKTKDAPKLRDTPKPKEASKPTASTPSNAASKPGEKTSPPAQAQGEGTGNAGGFGFGVGGIVAVFLFRIQPVGEADEWLWVVVGDLPSAYLVTDRAPSPGKALAVYCELMEEWIHALRSGGDRRRAFPVKAHPSAENASQLEKRIALLRKKILPACC